MLEKVKFKNVIRFLCSLSLPALVFGLLYYVYDFSLSSKITFTLYVTLAIVSVVALLFLTSVKRSLIKPFVIFELTYLSVYIISLGLNLNTSYFDFIKGVSFSLIAFSLTAYVRYFCLSFTNARLSFIAKIIFGIFLFLAILLPVMLVSYLVATGSLISSDIIIALAQTNPQESKEFFISNCNYRWLLAFICILVIYFVNLWAFKNVGKAKSEKKLFSLSYFLILLASVFLALPRMDYLPFAVVKVTSRQLNSFEDYKLQKAQRIAKLAQLKSLSTDDTMKKSKHLFVLVIGESETRDRMEAYGFDRKTTPYLCESLNDKNILLFKNVYSSWPQTVQSLSYALTSANQYNNIDTISGYSLIEIAKAVGYKTYWLSNQRKFGMYETPITVIASSADKEIWTNQSSKMEGLFFDSQLVEEFPKLNEDENSFVVIHLMGSHQKYDRRLPSDFFVFDSGDKTIDNYDNTLLYTDYIINEIYKKARTYKNFDGLVYFSDHGEDPYIVGGHDPVNVNGQMLRVPLVTYLSQRYVEMMPDVFTGLSENREKYISNDLVFNLVTSLMGVTGIPDTMQQFDISSDKYALDEKSVLTMYGKKHIYEITEKKIVK